MLRTLTSAALSVAIAATLVSIGTVAHAKRDKGPESSLGGPLVLADEGIFFVNGRLITSDYPTAPDPTPGSFVIEQMYVHYRIPAKQKYKTPIIMVHGGGLTGSTYETTPDGREGWATYFTRKGFPVYVVDFPGRGRAGFDPTIINRAIVENDISLVPVIRRTTLESAWTAFRFGPEYEVPYPNLQFPTDAVEQLSAQGVPYGEATLEGAALENAPRALVALLDKIGPSILLVHSQSGRYPPPVVHMRSDLVKAVINIEGNQAIIPTDEEIESFVNVPNLELFGDNVIGNSSSTGESRYLGRKDVVDRINDAGGDAEIVLLSDAGFSGNSHMLMQEKNNLEIADWLIEWIDEKVEDRGKGRDPGHGRDRRHGRDGH